MIAAASLTIALQLSQASPRRAGAGGLGGRLARRMAAPFSWARASGVGLRGAGDSTQEERESCKGAPAARKEGSPCKARSAPATPAGLKSSHDSRAAPLLAPPRPPRPPHPPPHSAAARRPPTDTSAPYSPLAQRGAARAEEAELADALWVHVFQEVVQGLEEGRHVAVAARLQGGGAGLGGVHTK